MRWLTAHQLLLVANPQKVERLNGAGVKIKDAGKHLAMKLSKVTSATGEVVQWTPSSCEFYIAIKLSLSLYRLVFLRLSFWFWNGGGDQLKIDGPYPHPWKSIRHFFEVSLIIVDCNYPRDNNSRTKDQRTYVFRGEEVWKFPSIF